MRKLTKLLAVLLSVIFVFAMVTGCNGAAANEDDSGGGKSNTEAESTAEDTTEEDAVEDTDESEEETPAEEETTLTGGTEITEKDIEEICTSIKEAIQKDYLEPNNLSVEEFAWPTEDSSSWGYLSAIYNSSFFSIRNNEEIEDFTESEYDTLAQSPEEKEILYATYNGVLDWLNSKGDYDADYFAAVFLKFYPFETEIPEKVTFDEE